MITQLDFVPDYLDKRKFPVIGNVADWDLRATTVATLVGVYQFNTNSIGASISVSSSVPIYIFPPIMLNICLVLHPLSLLFA